jgi:hypothetical protein
MANDDLDKQLAQVQHYFKKNMLDLSIDDVLEKVQQDGRVLLGAQASRTECLNYVNEACEVQHKSIRVRVAQEYGEFTYDNIDYVDFYVCNRSWFVNFTQNPELYADESEYSEEEIQEILDKMKAEIVLPGDENYEAWQAQNLEKLKASNLAATEKYLESLRVVGSKKLFPVSKPLHKDSKAIGDMIHVYRNRAVSLYHPKLENRMLEDHYHEPIRDPYLDAFDEGLL